MAKDLVVDSTSYDPKDDLIAGHTPELRTRRILLAASQGALVRGQVLKMDLADHTTGAVKGTTTNVTDVLIAGATAGHTLVPVYILSEDIADDVGTQYVTVYECGTFNEEKVLELFDAAPTAQETLLFRENCRIHGIFLRKVI